MTDKDSLASFFPIAYDVEEGKTYRWCSCGKSETQPLCDRNCIEAVEFKATITETVHFCGCKQTATPPLCDGSHAEIIRKLLKDYRSRS